MDDSFDEKHTEDQHSSAAEKEGEQGDMTNDGRREEEEKGNENR